MDSQDSVYTCEQLLFKLFGGVEYPKDGSPPIYHAVAWNPEETEPAEYIEEDPQIALDMLLKDGILKGIDMTESILKLFKENIEYINEKVPTIRFEKCYILGRPNAGVIDILQLFKNVEIYDSDLEYEEFTDEVLVELLKTTTLYIDRFRKERIDRQHSAYAYTLIEKPTLLALMENKPRIFALRGCSTNFSCEDVEAMIKDIIKDKSAKDLDWHLGTVYQYTVDKVNNFLNKLKEEHSDCFEWKAEEFLFSITFGNSCSITFYSHEDDTINYNQREKELANK